MHLADTRERLRAASAALAAYKLRSSLSMLGVVLGIAAVIAMMSVSEGAAREALTQVESLGLDNIVIRSERQSMAPRTSGALTVADADRLESVVPLVRASSPLLDRMVKVSSEHGTTLARMVGVRATYQEILRLAIARGRFLSVRDERTVSRTCVLGAKLARQLFGHRDPIGRYALIGVDHFEVVGVLRDTGADPGAVRSLAWRDVNQIAFVPFATMSGGDTAIDPTQPVDEVWLQVSNGSRVDELGRILEHTLAFPGSRGREVSIVVPRELLAQRYRTQRTFSIVVGSVAVLALLIGGIGIMNTMLTSVIERTREIGVRRTVGATRRDVLLQFLTEALLITLVGGIVGIVMGVGLSWAITAFAGWTTWVSSQAVVIAFAVALVVGLFFGLYPAAHAARLEPVDAMRHE